jgi:lipopolysaccharide/colanic/teichoic acid biosynthesis glycosyltransferase
MEVKEEILIAVPSEETYIPEKEIEPKVCVKRKPIYSFFKRTFDILSSLLGLFMLLLPLLIVALIVIIDSPGASPIYVQERIGKNGRKFKFYKFRSMIPNAEQMLDQLLEKNEMEGPAFKMKDDPRITRFGRFIRKTSIDELPQLWNVLKGERGIIETTKKNIGFSRVVAVNSIS